MGPCVVSGKRKYWWPMRTSPISPTPMQRRSGRVLPAARSASDTAPVRVLIGDSDEQFRRRLCASLAADPQLEVVGEADDGELALQLLRSLRPDVALLDEDMPSFGGAAIARVLRFEQPEVRVFVMTRSGSGARMTRSAEPAEIDFCGAVVCELRQPLTAINGDVELAMRLLETDPASALDALGQVATQLTRIDRLLVEL